MFRSPKFHAPHRKPTQQRHLASTTLAALLISPLAAMAADLPSDTNYAPGPIPQYQPYDWSGVYLGALLGYTWGDYDVESVGSIEDDAYMAGGFAGLNFQSGALVFGLEGDVTTTGLDTTSSGVTLENDLQATLRGRVGYAFDSILIYGTAGVAFADVTANDGTRSDSNWHSGYVVGGGAEAALTDHLFLRGEYLYTAFADETYELSGGPVDADLDSHTLRAGLGVKF